MVGKDGTKVLKLQAKPIILDTYGTLRALTFKSCPQPVRLFREHVPGLQEPFEHPGEAGLLLRVKPSLKQDLASQIYYWDAYKQQCKIDGRQRGRILSPAVGEYLAGPLTVNSK